MLVCVGTGSCCIDNVCSDITKRVLVCSGCVCVCVCARAQECTNNCCNANNCTLMEEAECAHGVCCKDCKVRHTHLCRPKLTPFSVSMQSVDL